MKRTEALTALPKLMKTASKQNILSVWKGSIPFQESLRLQEGLTPTAKQGKAFFLGFESRHNVITKGLRTENEDILWSGKQLSKWEIETVSLNRGGRATLHAPGQLVVYPVIHLDSFRLKVRDFILLLEDITKECLRDIGIVSERREKYSGLSTTCGKIAFFGIHVSEGVSRHGLSINVSNNLKLFYSIKSCGISNRPHDSLQNHQIPLSTKDLFEKWVKRAKPVFNQRYRSNGKNSESDWKSKSELLSHRCIASPTKTPLCPSL